MPQRLKYLLLVSVTISGCTSFNVPPPVPPPPPGAPPPPPPPTVPIPPSNFTLHFANGQALGAEHALLLQYVASLYKKSGSPVALQAINNLTSPQLIHSVRDRLVSFGVSPNAILLNPAPNIPISALIQLITEPPPVANGHNGGTPPRVNVPSLGSRPPKAPSAPSPAAPSWSEKGPWLSPTQTFFDGALERLLFECEQSNTGLSSDCQANVSGGNGYFRHLDADARKEMIFLLGACREVEKGAQCKQAIRETWKLRSLDRAVVKPTPLKMTQFVTTTFTAPVMLVRDQKSVSAAGHEIGTWPDNSDPTSAHGEGQTLSPPANTPIIVPISREMCFTLSGATFEITPQGEMCHKVSHGAVKYNPSWQVTPQKPGNQPLELQIRVKMAGRSTLFPHSPSPFQIDVAPAPTMWDRIDASLKRLTGTVGIATELVVGLGALITAVAGLGIWKWIKRRRRPRKQA